MASCPRPLPVPPAVAVRIPVAAPRPATDLDRRSGVAWLVVVAGGLALQPGSSVLLSLALAPWVEEVLFRRGVQDGLVPRVGPRTAVVATAMLFALAHAAFAIAGGAPPAAVALAAATIGPALVVGTVYRRTGSLAACVALHATCNAAWLALAARALPGATP